MDIEKIIGGISAPILVALLKHSLASGKGHLAKCYFVVFGVLTAIHGFIAYSLSGIPVLAAPGIVLGLSSIISGISMAKGSRVGRVVMIITSLLATITFVPVWMQSGAFFPAGLMAVFGTIGMITAILA